MLFLSTSGGMETLDYNLLTNKIDPSQVVYVNKVVG